MGLSPHNVKQNQQQEDHFKKGIRKKKKCRKNMYVTVFCIYLNK